jgi:hypothetical protein
MLDGKDNGGDYTINIRHVLYLDICTQIIVRMHWNNPLIIGAIPVCAG